MKNLLERFKEPSTHAGVAAMLQAVKVLFPAYGALIDGLTLCFGAVAVLAGEQSA